MSLHEAVVQQDIQRLTHLLHSQPQPDINALNADGKAPLHLAVGAGLNAVLVLLLDAGADVNRCTSTGHTPLHLAAVRGAFQATTTLLSFGADPERLAPNGSSALHLAAQYGNVFTSESLLSGGTRPDLPDGNGATPLELAVRHGHFLCIRALVDAGACTNGVLHDGSTLMDVIAQTYSNDIGVDLLRALRGSSVPDTSVEPTPLRSPARRLRS